MPASDPWLSRQNEALKLRGLAVSLELAGSRVRLRASIPPKPADPPLLHPGDSRGSRPVWNTRLVPARPWSEVDGPEWRLGLALATGSPYASLHDISLLLNDRIDPELLIDLQAGIPWIDRSGLPAVPAAEATIPWLPPDYLAGLLLNQWHFDEHVPIKGDRTRWQELLRAGRQEEAMAVALHRLQIAELVTWRWPVITASDPQRLLRAVEVRVHPASLGKLKARG